MHTSVHLRLRKTSDSEWQTNQC